MTTQQILQALVLCCLENDQTDDIIGWARKLANALEADGPLPTARLIRNCELKEPTDGFFNIEFPRV